MEKKAFQDYYSDQMSHCYGCGRLNDAGMKIKSYWSEDKNEETSIAIFTPKPYQTAFPGYVYGGLIASLIDCHGTGTAAAAAYRAEGREMDTKPMLRYVTASLHVNYIKPTPIDTILVLRGKVKEIKGRKVTVEVILSANGEICADGVVIAVRIPDTMLREES
ncbi:MAG: PaaI family thioesterase [Promethearchaeota archaeon]|jgi:acyl-coenzyme A thioesterase PaaI-like protein